MEHKNYYVTPREFMKHLEAAAREAYFTDDQWDKPWHPEDISSNLEVVLISLRGYLSSAIREQYRVTVQSRVAYDPPVPNCKTCDGTGSVMQIGTYQVVECAMCNGRG